MLALHLLTAAAASASGVQANTNAVLAEAALHRAESARWHAVVATCGLVARKAELMKLDRELQSLTTKLRDEHGRDFRDRIVIDDRSDDCENAGMYRDLHRRYASALDDARYHLGGTD